MQDRKIIRKAKKMLAGSFKLLALVSVLISQTFLAEIFLYKNGLENIARADGYAYRKTITVDHGQVSGANNFSNFPVLVSFTDSDLATTSNNGRVQNANGYDIVFMDQDGNQLDHEMESYDGSTGTIKAWVRVPTLSASADTTFYVYYDNPGINSSQEHKTSVWDTDYKAVWHLREQGTPAAQDFKDSTSNGNHSNNTADQPVMTENGKIGRGESFNGTSQYIGAPSPSSDSLNITNSGITLEAWVYPTASQGNIIRKIYTNVGYDLHIRPNQVIKLVSNGSSTLQTDSDAITLNAWNYVVATIDNSGNAAIYVNGENKKTGIITPLSTYTPYNIYLGGSDWDNGYFFGGTLDEARVSATNRSADWIATEYHNIINQGSGSGKFISSVGSGETVPAVAAPAFSPEGGNFTEFPNVSITTTTSGATICYTTDGSSDPVGNDGICTVGTTYTGQSIPVTSTTTIKAIATKAGYNASSMTSETYNISAVNTPTFSVSGGSYAEPQSVTIATTTPGATICYTTDGSAPEGSNGSCTAGTSSPNPVTVSSSLTLKAIATKSDMSTSPVAQATYAIGSWYNTEYAYRQVINISKVNIPSLQSDFPVLISLSDNNLKGAASYGGHVQSENGYDIIFTDASGNVLSHEIEKYVASEGTLRAWVKIPTLSPAADTTIFMYYGKSNAADTQNANAVWNNSYRGVWHLKEQGSNATLDYKDSTQNTNHSSNTNNQPTVTSDGEIGNAENFVGYPTDEHNQDDEIDTPTSDSLDVTGAITLEAWVYPTISDGNIVRKVNSNLGYMLFINTNQRLTLGANEFQHTLNTDANAITLNSWNHIVATIDNSGNANIYVNGSLVKSGTGMDLSAYSAGGLTIGGSSWNSGNYLNGNLDEVRISNTNRSADWIAIEYANQNNPANFYEVLGEETTPAATTPTFNPAAGTYAYQSVDIATTTSGATICYTTDGNAPTGSSGVCDSGINTYNGTAISVTSTTTIKAIATKAGYNNSSEASATYTINGWYNDGYAYRKAIAINHSQVSGTSNLTNFPVLVSLTDTDLKDKVHGGKVESDKGYDIIFTDEDGNTLFSSEQEFYAADSGTLKSWVKIPSLSPAQDTTIYMYYGNSNITSSQETHGDAWDGSYKGVWHLKEQGDGTAGIYKDSTGNNNNNNNRYNQPVMTGNGQIGNAQSFDGETSQQYISAAATTSLDITGAITIEAWVYPTIASGANLLRKVDGSGNGYYLMIDPSNKRLDLFSTTDLFTSNNALALNEWSHVVGTVDSSGNGKIYINGSLVASRTGMTLSTHASTTPLTIGGINYFNGGYLSGNLDEVRLSATDRPADWIKTEYDNAINQGAGEGKFISAIGAEQEGPNITPISFQTAPGTYVGAQNVEIKTSTNNATICYTTDGVTEPQGTNGTCSNISGINTYEGPISVSATGKTTIKAIATKAGATNTEPISGDFIIIDSNGIVFTTSGASFSPVIKVTGTPTITWTFADGTTSNSTNPTVNYGTAASRPNGLVVTPWSALTDINVGYDEQTFKDDGGPDFSVISEETQQNVTAVSGLGNVASSLQRWASVSNPITSLDFSNFTALTDAECYDCESLSSVALDNNVSLLRLEVEKANLTTLDISDAISLHDLRSALQGFSTEPHNFSINWGNIGSNLWHICSRDNTQLQTQVPFGQLPNLGEIFLWHANQSGAFNPVSTSLTKVYVANNNYTSADLSDLFTSNNAASVDLSDNDLTSVDLSNDPDIASLKIYDNNLSNLNVASITGLISLDAHGNSSLNSLNVSSNTALNNLNVSGNGMSSLNISSNSVLHVLNVSNNIFSSVDISNNPAIRELYAQNNSLSQAAVDSILGTLDAETVTGTLKVYLNGTGNAQPSSTTRMEHVTSLINKGWEVQVN